MTLRRSVKWLMAAGVLFLVAWGGFRRTYVIPAGGLLDITAMPKPNGVVVSGVLLSSMAHVSKTRVDRYKDGVIVRVYVELIRQDDDLKKLTRAFSVAVPTSQDTRVIYVGDGEDWETVGDLYGLPIRVPHHRDGAAKAVWRDGAK